MPKRGLLDPGPEAANSDHAEDTIDRADSPETHDAAVHQEASNPQPVIVGTDVPVAPPTEGTREAAEEDVKHLEQAPPPEDERELPELPKGAFDSEAYRAANSGARDAFGQVVRRPGHIFRDHGGRYVNIFDLNEVYDVEPGTIVPDGLFLFPVNYLVREEERASRVRG